MAQPTQQEAARAARHKGFQNSIQHHPEDKRTKLYERYKPQDARREKNVSGFVAQIRAAK